MKTQSSYGVLNIRLQAKLPREERGLLAARLRCYRQVAAVTVLESQITIYYKGTLPVQLIHAQVVKTVARVKEESVSQADLLSEFDLALVPRCLCIVDFCS